MIVYITGAAGFIGFHLSQALLNAGHTVRGIDSMSDYYDIRLKEDRLALLRENDGFSFSMTDISDANSIMSDIGSSKPDIVFHLAAQAGVRYSLDEPATYVTSNLVGTANLLEAIRHNPVKHLLFASTSSVYGGNLALPFSELHTTDAPQSLYAATKRGCEALLHSYSHLFGIPTTAFRFFTVYGPWGRPDMALFKFVRAAMDGGEIDVYGYGQPSRDFTYIDDLVSAVLALAECVPEKGKPVSSIDSLSPVAPFRIVNIAGGKGVKLPEFIAAVESATAASLPQRQLPMQPGDVMVTEADPELLRQLTGTVPRTDVTKGVSEFVRWYREYYE